MSTPSAEQFLMGAGGRSAKFKQIGDEISGFIQDQEVRNQTNPRTREIEYWKDGSPKKQLVVTLQTEQREDAEDDGLRKLYIKGKNLTDAVRDAVRIAGAKSLEFNGWIRVAYIGDGQPAGPAVDPPKLYLAEYKRPAPQAASQFLSQSGGQPQQQRYAPQPPQPQQPAAPAWPQQPTAQPPF